MLTTELAEGVRFEVVETWSQDERDLAAESIFRFVFGSLYRLHAFNGDPHPGNYLFRPGGQVTFLDFGLVKRFEPEEIKVLERMITAMVLDHDIPEYRRTIEEIGMLQPGAPFTDAEVEDYFGHFYDFVLRDEVAHHHLGVRVGDGAPLLRRRRALRPDHEGGQRAARRS